MGHSAHDPATKGRPASNAGRKLGAKRALKPQQVWAIRFWLDRERCTRDRAMFDLAIVSKLRGCDIVKLKIGDPPIPAIKHDIDRRHERTWPRPTGNPANNDSG